MKPEYAQVLIALIEADAQAFADKCNEVLPDDGETLGNDIIDWLATEAGTEEDTTEEAE